MRPAFVRAPAGAVARALPAMPTPPPPRGGRPSEAFSLPACLPRTIHPTASVLGRPARPPDDCGRRSYLPPIRPPARGPELPPGLGAPRPPGGSPARLSAPLGPWPQPGNSAGQEARSCPQTCRTWGGGGGGAPYRRVPARMRLPPPASEAAPRRNSAGVHDQVSPPPAPRAPRARGACPYPHLSGGKPKDPFDGRARPFP